MLAQALRPIGAALDPDRIRRAAADTQPPDPRQLARTLGTVPDRLDDMIGDATDALREAAQHLPVGIPVARPRRRGPGAARIAVVLGGFVAIGAAALAAALVAIRLRARSLARAEEARLEEAALDRAAGEGMDGTVPALGAEGVRPVAVPMGHAPDEVVGTAQDPADLSGTALAPAGSPVDRAFDDVVVRPTVGIGSSADR
ncbi:MAG: hypothetical protein AB1627_11655 [Chloroflexota bacterium]